MEGFSVFFILKYNRRKPLDRIAVFKIFDALFSGFFYLVERIPHVFTLFSFKELRKTIIALKHEINVSFGKTKIILQVKVIVFGHVCQFVQIPFTLQRRIVKLHIQRGFFPFVYINDANSQFIVFILFEGVKLL